VALRFKEIIIITEVIAESPVSVTVDAVGHAGLIARLFTAKV
jgi:hypothetical protein